jgi:hypothetical protein
MGLQLFVLGGVSGYAYILRYILDKKMQKKNRLLPEPDLGASANVVVRLSRCIPKNVNHKVYFDNYYTSVPLEIYLYKQGILSLGTIRKNRLPNRKFSQENVFKKNLLPQ